MTLVTFFKVIGSEAKVTDNILKNNSSIESILIDSSPSKTSISLFHKLNNLSIGMLPVEEFF